MSKSDRFFRRAAKRKALLGTTNAERKTEKYRRKYRDMPEAQRHRERYRPA